ncbi:FAD-dependent oxidoreductase [Nostoc sp.]|uniref:FAD-dependent oxidoreductase n=1 Tax=Nostoc sp. TaxID=1180 RepID=UPI002FF74428
MIDGYLFPPDLKSIDEIQQELEAVHRVGLTNVEMVKKAPLSDFYTGVCLRFPQQGQFDPLKYLTGLAEAIQRRGGRIYPEAHVEKIPGGLPARVETSSGKVVRADAVVVATNSPNEVTSVENKYKSGDHSFSLTLNNLLNLYILRLNERSNIHKCFVE